VRVKRRTGTAVRILILALLAVLLQATLLERIRILGIGPDLSILLVVYVALWRGAETGTLVGFLVGLAQGTASPVHFGAHSLAKSALGFSVGTARVHLVRESLPTQAAVIIGAHLLHDLIFLPLTLNGAGSFVVVWVTRTLPTALYSAVLGCVLYRFLMRPMGLDLRSHGASLF
jgi:rod shape-determining protein MreD